MEKKSHQIRLYFRPPSVDLKRPGFQIGGFDTSKIRTTEQLPKANAED
jgi:hypothetical protein